MKYNHGLVLGKFYPPHLGHLHLIIESKKRCKQLTVVISSISKEVIPGHLRFSWLKELLPDNGIEIIWIQDENPQYPEEHPDFWQIWKRSIQRVLKSPIDVIFTSEEYGEPLANTLNCKHECIDLNRNQFPISATKIRNAPLKSWDFIPDLIKPYFLKRIVLTGPESVGKSTLAKNLANYFQTSFVSEYAREYLDRQGRYVIASDIPEIGRGHLLSEMEGATRAKKFLFIDTDHLTTKIYSEHYFSQCPEWVKTRALRLKYDHSLLLDIDVPWVEDPQRDLGAKRGEMKDIFINEMKAANRSYTMISGSFEKRFETSKRIIQEIGELPMNPSYFTETQIHLRNV